MKDSKKTAAPHTLLHDGFGLALVVVSALLGVSAYMYLKTGPIENPTAYTALMTGLVRFFGPPAVLWLAFGALFIGARLVVFGAERGSLRDPFGFLFTAVGLSILLGALSDRLGGSLSVLVVGHLWAPVGVALGLGLIVASAWAIWLRSAPPAVVARVGALIGETPAGETPAAAPGVRTTRSAPPVRAATEDPSGVTSAEADALLPGADRDEIMAALRSANRQSATTVNHAPSPYPADVRREGGIPAGASPITSHEPGRSAPATAAPVRAPAAAAANTVAAGQSASRPGAVRAWNATKPVAGEVGAGRDLAASQAAGSAVAGARAPAAAELKPAAPAARFAESPPAAQPAPATGASAIPIPSSSGPIGSPVWEGEEDAALDAEPELAAPAAANDALVVDAYGTPLEVVAALRGDIPAAELQAPSGAAEVEEWAAGTSATAGGEPALDAGSGETLAEEDEESDGDPFPAASAEEQDALDEDEDELAFDDEVEEQAALTPTPGNAAAESEREVVLQPVQNSLFDAPPAAPAVEKVAAEAPAPTAKPAALEPAKSTTAAAKPEPAKPAPAATQPESAKPTLAAAKLESAKAAPTPAHGATSSATAATNTKRAPAATSKRADAPAAKASAAPKERTVVLDPQPAPVEETIVPDDDVVYRSGMLFLKHKRVAVSMLQREFALDFKQATAVLDQLQAQGLIGPYLGGQRRDILLTAEEWRAKVGAAS